MSLSLVWFAVQGIEPDVFLERAGLVDTGEPDEYFEAEVAGCSLPGGWYVMLADDLELVEVDNLREWSEGGRLVAVAVQEQALFSLVAEWRDGRPGWSLSHEPDETGEPVVSLDGVLPEAFDEVRRDFVDPPGAPAERVFMAPIELAWRVTGFRHDTLGFSEDVCAFTALAEG